VLVFEVSVFFVPEAAFLFPCIHHCRDSILSIQEVDGRLTMKTFEKEENNNDNI
jgi:hypothetical protein